MGKKYQSVTVIGKKEQRVKALLDSGASTVYIDSVLAKKIGIPFLRKTKVMLGNGIEMNGYDVVFMMKVRNRIKPVKAVAMRVPEKLVIGHDFMQDNDVIIDYKNEKISFSQRIPQANRRLRI